MCREAARVVLASFWLSLTHMRAFSRAWPVTAALGLVGAIGSTAMAQNAALPPLPAPPGEDPGANAALPPPLPATTLDEPPKPPAQSPASPDPSAVDSTAPDATVAPPGQPDPWETRPFMVEGHLGLGTPVGVLGIALDYSPWPLLGLNLGIGLGGAGPQYAFTSRLRLLRLGHRTRVALYLGAGVSGGSYEEPTPLAAFPVDGSQTESAGERAHFHWDVAYWTNVEAGVEIRLRSNVSLRPYLGVSRLLNPDPSATIKDAYSGMPPGNPVVPWSAYVGFALGYAMAGW